MYQMPAAMAARESALQTQIVWRSSKELLALAAFMHISSHSVCWFQE